jgi:predicted protein tyrosine phosphatase
MMRALFVCSANRLRSPTAEQIFSTWSNVETDSAGLNAQAECRLSNEQLEWATIIFVMERSHQSRLQNGYRRLLKDKRVICLNIPDKFAFMDETLVALLMSKVGPYLAGEK